MYYIKAHPDPLNIERHGRSLALQGLRLKTPVRQYCCYLGFDNQYGQSSCFENKYQPLDVTFIFHSVSALQLLE